MFEKLKVLFKLKGIANDAQKKVTTMDGTKPGYKTTEFWGKTIVQIIVILNMTYLKEKPLDPAVGLALITGAEGVYTAVRGLVKAFQKPNPCPPAQG